MKFTILNELEAANYSHINLTDNQKIVLILAAISATPIQAFESTSGKLELVLARNILVKLNYINVFNNELSITNVGMDALIDHNLIDDSGVPTNDGNELLNSKNMTDNSTANL